MNTRLLLSVCVPAGLLYAAAFGQVPQVRAQLTVAQKTAVAGGKDNGVVKVTFPEGLHGYQNPPTKDYMIPVAVAAKTKAFKLQSVKYPKGVARKTVGEEGDVMVYDGTVEIPVVIQMPSKPGPVSISLAVSWQTCTDAECGPPEEVVVTQKIVVTKPKVKKAK
jgi:DsbC/DsbD-like thiol-disulfide interchange protein